MTWDPHAADGAPAPLELTLARFPLPPVEPRLLLQTEALRLGTHAVPRVLMAGAGAERLVVTGLPEGEEALGRAQAALLALEEVEWVGGYGQRLIHRGPAPEVVLAAWWRGGGGEAWLRIWPAVAGEAPRDDLAEAWDGSAAELPGWVGALLARPAEGTQGPAVRFTEAPTTMEAWPGDPRLPPPDATLPVEDDAVVEVALATAAAFLEDRFSRTGRTEPLLFAWQPAGLSFYWSIGRLGARALRVLGQALGRDGRTAGLGLFGLGEDRDLTPPVPMVALVFETRAGQTFMWRRRFRSREGGRPEWLDARPQVRGGVAPLGMFPPAGSAGEE